MPPRSSSHQHTSPQPGLPQARQHWLRTRAQVSKSPLLHLLHLWEPSPHSLSLLIREMDTVILAQACVGVS